MAQVLILGAGFGGLSTAHALRRQGPADLEVLVVDRRESFAMGFRKTWGFFDPARYREGLRPLAKIAGNGVRFRRGTVEEVLPAEKAVVVDGERLEAEALVLALGPEHVPEAIPGLAGQALVPYDADQIEAIHGRITEFQGGRVGVGIFGIPHTCPPAPYELAYLLNEFFQERGIEARLEVFTPTPMSLPVLGESGCSVIEDRLAERGIRFLPNHQALKVDGRAVHFATGPRSYDLLLAVPPHRGPRLLESAGLLQEGWVRPDPQTLETRFPDVYAIGDLTWIPMANDKPLPMAGVFAQAEGEVVAARILDRLAGRTPQATFEGYGGCYLEIGGGEALHVEGHFLARPAPQVSISGPSAALLEAKREFERERLKAWFGG